MYLCLYVYVCVSVSGLLIFLALACDSWFLVQFVIFHSEVSVFLITLFLLIL